LPMFFLYLKKNFNGRFSIPGRSESNGPIFTKISGLIERRKGLFTSFSFFRFLKGRCHGNQLKSKNWRFVRNSLLCRATIAKRIAISQFRFQKIKYNEFLYIVYNFGDIRSRNPRVYTVNNNTFCGDTAKIGISRQISQNFLGLSWPTS